MTKEDTKAGIQARNIVFVCGARDFHAMDKYWLTVQAVYPRRVLLLTDLIESENQPKLINHDTPVYNLFNIDKLLFKKQSATGNIWRNIIKLLFIPIQVYYLKKFYREHDDKIFHAITMYYMVLCYLSKIPFVATPQASEVLVRPFRSKIYMKYASRALKAARVVIVDSLAMQTKVAQIAEVQAVLVKNGFSVRHMSAVLERQTKLERNKILSIRGLNPNYRIEQFFEAREKSKSKPSITMVYPFCEEDYKKALLHRFLEEDRDLGKLNKEELYEEMAGTLLAISIPQSDSSPRSVYECIFAGACVAVSYSSYLEELPSCMKNRIYIVNLENDQWLDEAIDFARIITKTQYKPSEGALDMCDQERTIRKVISVAYG